MCKYCKLIENECTGEKENNYVSIMRIKDGCHISGAFIRRYICEKDDIRDNELVIDTAVNIGGCRHMIKENFIKIKYCPFCGEKL